MTVEFPFTGIGGLMVVILLGVYTFLLLLYIVLALFDVLLRTIQEAARRA